MYMCVCVCVCVCVLFWSHLQCSYLSRHSKFMYAILQELPKLWAVVSYLGYILMVLVATQLFYDKLMCVILYPAYTTGLRQESIPKYVLISPASAIYAPFVLIMSTKNQGINTVRLIIVPHLKLFTICSVTGPTSESANICHAPGLAQARLHDAMHLSI